MSQALLDRPVAAPEPPVPDRRPPGRAARWRTSWRLALRLAVRQSWRHRGRSALVVLLIALPLMLMSAFDVLAHGTEPTAQSKATGRLGTADLDAVRVSTAPVKQTGPHTWDTRKNTETENTDVRPVLPAGARAVAVGQNAAPVAVRTGDRALNVDVLVSPAADPLAAGREVLLEGGAPQAGQVAVSPGLGDALGVRPGDRLTLPGLRTEVTVTGVMVSPGTVVASSRYLVGPLESFPRLDARLRWLVDLPAGTDPAAARAALNARGVVVETRAEAGAPDPLEDSASEALAYATVPAALALAEVVLLAGAAITVGVRRQRRDLGLMGAAGADPRQVRRVVLAGGGVLGLAGGLLGTAAGVAVAYAGYGTANRLLAQYQLQPFAVAPLDLLVLLAVAVGTALLAALVPARAAARRPVVESLGARTGVRRTRRWPALVGAVVAAGGLAMTLVPPRLVDEDDLFWVAGGTVTALLGLLLAVSALVGVAARLGGGLTLAARLALRDAARNRGRTTPAVAAVTAAVALAVGSVVLTAALDARERAEYRPQGPPGTVSLRFGGDPTARRAVDQVAAVLPVTQRVPRYNDGLDLYRPECPKPAPGRTIQAGDCPTDLFVGDADLLRLILGRTDPAAERALAAGSVVVFDSRIPGGDRVRVAPLAFGQEKARPVSLPAWRTSISPGAPTLAYPGDAAVVSVATARRISGAPDLDEYLLLTSRVPTAAEEARANAVLADAGAQTTVIGVERGYHDDVLFYLTVGVLAGVGLVTLGAVAVAAALALAESGRDLDTLYTVGAAPRVRKRMGGWQAATICLLGTVLGTLGGLVPIVAVLRTGGSVAYGTVLPALAAVVVVLPVLAWLGGALCTRATRRVTLHQP